MKLFTVLDSAVNAYLPPFHAPSERDALSSFEHAANDPQSNISKYPSDFTLYQVAEFDTQSGALTVLPKLLNLGNASKFLNTKNKIAHVTKRK